ncbi:major capsid protein [Vibrio panuliri]|uniref:Capsid Gp10A/Gp10B-like domain-containing protein n=1 Tax=Vibrio panuliri TaxID=1381081 RepID=A0ABX3FJH9_9VIBR|nr:phage major capsid protein [Vibrio panuliri]KAB1460889.1 capsid protein [Vibrio panuliri]OLQ91642.1 hypothetical protein BIY20_09575 [Vibrio panuliri]
MNAISDKDNTNRELFLKLFAGEVLTMFRPKAIAMGLTRVRTIQNGKSASFPIIGRTTTGYHKPGDLIQTEKIKHAERIVTIDDIAVAPVFIAEIDEAMNHYDVRAQYASECSSALAEMVDRNIFRILMKTALSTTKDQFIKNFPEADFGKVHDEEDFVENVKIGTSPKGEDLVNGIYKARTILKKANVNVAEAKCIMRPTEYELLINAAHANGNMAWMHKDYGGTGGVNTGDNVLRIAGIPIYETNNMPEKDETDDVGPPVKPRIDDPTPLPLPESGRTDLYKVDSSKVAAIVFTKDAVCTVKLKDLRVEHIPEPLRLGHNILAKLAVGHNPLRPTCAVALVKEAAVYSVEPETQKATRKKAA